MTFDEAFQRLLGHEGGFVDHPADPGGATNWGITQRVAREHGYTGDMREFPVVEAKRIARRAYWDAVSADAMPPALRFDLFDAAYNSGPAQAVKWMQRALSVDDDGKVGPKTLMAAQAYNPAAVLARFNGHRLEMLASLSTWPAFGRGWVRRVAANLKETRG